jgi:hypothetical protein
MGANTALTRQERLDVQLLSAAVTMEFDSHRGIVTLSEPAAGPQRPGTTETGKSPTGSPPLRTVPWEKGQPSLYEAAISCEVSAAGQRWLDDVMTKTRRYC